MTMKNKTFLKMVGLAICLLVIGLWIESCSAAAAAQPTCLDTSDGCGGTFESCCTSSKCWYNYKGNRYNCDGTDCDSAAADLADDMLAACSANLDDENARISAKEINEISKDVLSTIED